MKLGHLTYRDPRTGQQRRTFALVGPTSANEIGMVEIDPETWMILGYSSISGENFDVWYEFQEIIGNVMFVDGVDRCDKAYTTALEKYADELEELLGSVIVDRFYTENGYSKLKRPEKSSPINIAKSQVNESL